MYRFRSTEAGSVFFSEMVGPASVLSVCPLRSPVYVSDHQHGHPARLCVFMGRPPEGLQALG